MLICPKICWCTRRLWNLFNSIRNFVHVQYYFSSIEKNSQCKTMAQKPHKWILLAAVSCLNKTVQQISRLIAGQQQGRRITNGDAISVRCWMKKRVLKNANTAKLASPHCQAIVSCFNMISNFFFREILPIDSAVGSSSTWPNTSQPSFVLPFLLPLLYAWHYWQTKNEFNQTGMSN